MIIDRVEIEVSDHYTYRRPFYCFPQTLGDCTRVEVSLDFYVPFLLGFYPDIQHINWVKRAWGLMPEVKPLKTELDEAKHDKWLESDYWVDLIPF